MASGPSRRGFIAAATGMAAATILPINAQAGSRVPGSDASAWRLFGRDGFRVPNGVEQHAAWQDVMRRARLAGSPAWRSLVSNVRRRGGSDVFHLVSAANAVLNRLPYRADEARYRAGDRWLDPDTFVTFGGDCEDFAIAKYFMLRNLRVPADSLRVVTGFDSEGVRGHALAVARVDDRLLVLDNRYRWPRLEAEFPNFRPRLSFNESGLWLYR